MAIFGRLLASCVLLEGARAAEHKQPAAATVACAEPGWDIYDPARQYATTPAPCCNSQKPGLVKDAKGASWICPLPGCALSGWDVHDDSMHYVFGTPASCCDGQAAVQEGSRWVCPASTPRAFPFGCGVGIAGDWPNVGQLFDTTYEFNLTAQLAAGQAIVDQQAGAHAKPIWRYDWRATEHPYSPNKWTYMGMDWCNHDGMGTHPDPKDPNSVGLMGWNEPNSAAQCNQNPANDTKAVAEFVKLAASFKAVGKLVVSPAPTKQASTWMDDFLAEVARQGSRDMDYLAYHHYLTCDSNPRTTPEEMYAEMEDELQQYIGLMQKYNGKGFTIKGIWITEIACQPDGGWMQQPWKWTPGASEDLMEKFMELVDKHVELKAWAWFPYAGFGPLWDIQPPYTALTALGRRYFGNCHQDRALATGLAEIVV